MSAPAPERLYVVKWDRHKGAWIMSSVKVKKETPLFYYFGEGVRGPFGHRIRTEKDRYATSPEDAWARAIAHADRHVDVAESRRGEALGNRSSLLLAMEKSDAECGA